jgi:hypothetical protein
MQSNPIRGKTIRWTFSDGPMANKTFEHSFAGDGSVTWRMIGSTEDKPGSAKKYEVATVGQDVYAVSYLSSSGYTLTVVLDYRTGRLVAFASNEKQLVLQHGTFEAPSTSRTHGPAHRSHESSHASRPR